MTERQVESIGVAGPQWSPGAQRILRAAAELFARHGYFATTTRDIATAAGVKQPAIYKHFSTKDAILVALVRLGLEYPFELAEQLQSLPASSTVRLYYWMSRSLRHFQESPFVLASMLITPELQQDQFVDERSLFDRLEHIVVELVAAGQAEGDFRVIDPVEGARLVLTLFAAIAVPETAVAPTEIAQFALAGLLSDPGRLPQVRRCAEELDQYQWTRSGPARSPSA